jgi:hypothetical protein
MSVLNIRLKIEGPGFKQEGFSDFEQALLNPYGSLSVRS